MSKKWHEFVYKLLQVLVGPFIRAAMAYEHSRERTNAASIIIANHTTDLDPVLVGLAFERHMYFVASEHIVRKGIASWLLVHLFAPIIRLKGRTEMRTAKQVLKTLKQGTNVGLFAEGARTWDGRTLPIVASTAKLVKASGADLVTFRIEGGYFTQPRWGKKLRRGKMRGRVAGRYTAAELSAMDAGQIGELIARDIGEDAYARQAADHQRYKCARPAEHLELALYLCPACGRIGTLSSEANELRCGCGMTAALDEYGMLHGAAFDTITAWSDYQREALSGIVRASDGPVCTDEDQALYAVQARKSSELVSRGRLTIGHEGLACGEAHFAIEQLTGMAIVGKTTITFSAADGRHYEIRTDHVRSAVKYSDAYEILRGH